MGKGVWERRAQAPPTETAGEVEASPRSPSLAGKQAEVEFKGGRGGYVITSRREAWESRGGTGPS
jgi:hypothetical protein